MSICSPRKDGNIHGYWEHNILVEVPYWKGTFEQSLPNSAPMKRLFVYLVVLVIVVIVFQVLTITYFSHLVVYNFSVIYSTLIRGFREYF